MLRKIKRYIRKLKSLRHKDSILSMINSTDHELIKRVRNEKLTYLSEMKLASLAGACHDIDRGNVPGLIIEAGCALGGSSIVLASIKSKTRQMNVHDVFGMIPPPTAEDTPDVHERYKVIAEGKSKGIDGDRYYGYEENLLQIVKSNFSKYQIDIANESVELIEGLVQDTLEVSQPVALAHIDVDWFEPVMTCLTRIFPALSTRGVIILDDYHDWGGCRQATDKYLEGVSGQYELDDRAGSLKITKI